MSATHRNFIACRKGKARAVCCCCGKVSRPGYTHSDGQPDLFGIARGWSEAPYSVDFQHDDGSFGSMYYCPSCNKRLAAGESLSIRGGQSVSSLRARGLH